MKHSIPNKLKSRRGSGIAEALVGFLISVLSVLILFGIVSTTADLIQEGDSSLQKFYVEESILDRFNVSGSGISDYSGKGELLTRRMVNGVEKSYSITVAGDPEHAPGTQDFAISSSGTVDGSYFVTEKYHMFAFSSD